MDEEHKIQSVETLCYNCNKMGETQTIVLPYSSMPTEVIHAFFCPHCNTRDVGFYDKEKTMHRNLVVNCHFESKEDLQRYVYLQEGAKVFFYEGTKVFYKYEVPTSTVVVIEMLLTSLVRKLAELDNLEPTEELVFSDSEKEIKPEEDKENLMQVIEKIKKLRDSGKFRFVIHDPKGKSRVGKRGQLNPDDLYSAKVAELNDEFVTHKYPRKKNE